MGRGEWEERGVADVPGGGTGTPGPGSWSSITQSSITQSWMLTDLVWV